MILIPIGRDQTEVRRNPWVSYVVIALNVLVFVFVNLGTERVHLKKLDAKYLELVTYVQDHPYLVLPESARSYFHESVPEDMAIERSARGADGSLPIPFTLNRQQRELEKLAAELDALVDDLPSRRLGFVPAEPQFLSRLTSMFVHADLIHLLGNLLFFFATGPFLEDVFGKPLFGILYVLSGIVSTFAFQSQHPGSETCLIGASGAIAGVMGAYFLRFLRSRTRFLCIPFVLLWRLSFRFFAPAYIVFPFWFAAQVLFAMNESEGETSTAFSAHVGGFLVGVLATGLVKFFQVEEKYIDPSITAKISWSQNPLLEEANQARRAGDRDEAKRRVAACLAAEPDNPDARVMACDLAREAEDWDGWSEQVVRLLDLYARRRESELAVQLVDESIRTGGDHLPARFYMRAADFLSRIPDEKEWARDLYKHAVEKEPQAPIAVRALVRFAQLARQTRDFEAARRALDRAGSHPSLDADYANAIELERGRLTREA